MKKITRSFLKRFPILFSMFLFCLSIITTAFAQNKDSKGTDFWLMFNTNVNTPTLTLFIASDVNTSGTVTIPGLAFSIPFTVAANSVTPIAIPVAAQVHTNNIVDTKGIHVTALQEVTVYGLNYAQFTTDAYLGLPTDVLANEYIIMSYSGNNFSELGVVATVNATVVTITPSVAAGSHAAGVPYNINLNQGQTYELSGASDLTGTIITSTQPVGVMGANACANIPPNYAYCDHINEMIPPTVTWGTKFGTVPLRARTNGDTWRFLASENATVVSINGVAQPAINRGQYLERILTVRSVIESTKPILVSQFANGSDFSGNPGDPFMMFIPPLEQFLNKYTVTTVSGYAAHYINIVAPAAIVGSLLLDGAVVPSASFIAIGTSGYSGAQVTVATGIHNLSASLPFGVFMYGFNTDDSYGYPGGQSFSPIRLVKTIALTPETGTAPVGTSQCFEALAKDQFDVPVADVKVDFGVTGANPGSTSFAYTDVNGIAHFCYTGTNVGTDNIKASVGDVTDAPSTFVWTQGGIIYYSKAAGDLHNVLTWGLNSDGSGTNPPDFGAGKTFMLANRVVNYMLTANWTVGGKLNIPAASQLQIGAYTLSVADILGTGAFNGTVASNLIVTQPSTGNTSLNFLNTANNLNNLTISSSASTALASPLNVYGVLTGPSSLTTTTVNILTLKSTSTNTARVAQNTTVIGPVTVERYIPSKRAWRIMSAPVGGSQTINAAWQEGATTSSVTPNPVPGYGTHITEGNAASGLDHNPLTAMSSIKTYISSIDSWVPLLNTNSLAVNADAYMLFVRGDRGIPLGLNTVPPTSTTLRATGTLKAGDQSFPVSASGFTAIPNPFASPINFATLEKNNVQSNFYLWDPKLGGEYGVGGYVLLSYNGSSYDVIPASVSPESQYIQSGQGFLVYSTGSAGSLVIKESDKSATDATNVFRQGGSGRPGNGTPFNDTPLSTTTSGLRINLQAINEDNSTAILDEVFSSYGLNYSDKVDNLDAQKMANVQENMAIVRDNHQLMVDRSSMLDESDLIQLKIWNTSAKKYLLEFNPVSLNSTVSTAYLIDRYLKTSTPIDLHKLSQVYFTVNADAASANASRFTVVFKAGTEVLSAGNKAGITSYPNPVSGKTIQLLFTDQPQGTYKVEMVNGLGQVVNRAQIQHGGGSAVQHIELRNKPASGFYLLNVTNSATKNTMKIIVNK